MVIEQEKLRLIMWMREVGKDEKKPVGYYVHGLPTDDACYVVYGGLNWTGKETWYVHRYRSGQRTGSDQGPYESPESALDVIQAAEANKG